MHFNRNLGISDRHAFLSPSSYSWLNYDDVKLENRFYTVTAARRGSDLHDLAHEAIRLKVYFDVERDPNQKALALYVNDGIDLRMSCEVPLYYSENCFGHADNISFTDDKLRIHDLKTGVTATSFKQLEIYAALFCLQYGEDPNNFDTELRIYQRTDITILEAVPEAIEDIMQKIVEFDLKLTKIKENL